MGYLGDAGTDMVLHWHEIDFQGFRNKSIKTHLLRPELTQEKTTDRMVFQLRGGRRGR
jgi:cephalosporin-C deacetylase-like acetyl esterase